MMAAYLPSLPPSTFSEPADQGHPSKVGSNPLTYNLNLFMLFTT